MKKIEISKKIRAELIGRMICDAEIIESTQLNIIKENYKHPEFDYDCPNSMWELYQKTTQAMREIHPTLWMKKHIEAHKFFVEASNLIVPEFKKIELPIINQLELFTV